MFGPNIFGTDVLRDVESKKVLSKNNQSLKASKSKIFLFDDPK